MDVGIRQLKENLAEYLDRAARGEQIVVTDRGQPKAMMVPIPGSIRLKQGIEEKWIRPGVDSPPRAVPRVSARRSIEDVLAEDKAE
jgi:prevent-host-death family protein